MIESGSYPPGAEFDNNAPYNQEDLPEEEVEVTISVTLSKNVKVKINDYKVHDSMDGTPYLEYSDYALKKAVEEQIVLPQNLAEFTERMFGYDLGLKEAGIPRYLKEAIKDCKGWYIDDMEVIL